MKKAVIFDLDGTMWDSSREVTEAYNIALEKQGLEKRFTVADIKGAMGKTMVEIAHIAFDCYGVENAVGIMQRCIDEENSYLTTHSGQVYPGLEEMLSKLRSRGYLIACVSNCQQGYIEAFYQATGLGKYFDDKTCWGDTGLLKADNIRIVTDRLGTDFAVYVGDTEGDYNSAKEAGTAFIHAAYGFGKVPAGTPKIDDIRELAGRVEEVEKGFFGR